MERQERVTHYQDQSRIIDEMVARGEKDQALRLLKSLETKATGAKDLEYQAFFAAEQISYSSNDHAAAAQRLMEGINLVEQAGGRADPYLLCTLALYYRRGGNQAGSVASLDKVIQQDPKDAMGMLCKGVSFSEKGNRRDALTCFGNALANPNFNWKAETLLLMGNTFAQVNQNEEAIQCWKQAAELFQARGQQSYAGIAERKIAAATKNPKQRSSKDRAALTEALPIPGGGDENAPERRILAKLDKVEQTKYEEYGKRFETTKHEEEVFAVLRGWGSAIGLLPAKGVSPCRGGGYLLKWRGKGLLIDPGFDCLANLHDAGFHCREVNAVVVSHNHSDHNDDLRSFDDIRYEMYDRADNANDDEGRKAWEYVLLWDQDTKDNRKFDTEEAKHRREKFMESSSRSVDAKYYDPEGLPFRIHWFKARHGDDVRHALGLRVDCLNADGKPQLTFGFTCDTEFFPELCDEHHLGKCDILIAHISMPSREEYTDPKHEKKRHLGYRGVEKLIKGAKPKLAIIGEFWAGIADLRIDLVNGLRELCKNETRSPIIPASIGLQLKPSTKEIRCTNCRDWTGFDKVQIGSPAVEFGPLSYLCPNCRLG